MRRIATVVALAATLTASAALAADPAGDWTGTLRTPAGALQLGLEVRRDAKGRYEARYDDLTQNYRGLPMRRLADAAQPSFRIRSLYGTMTYVWNPARGGWDGRWRELSGEYRFVLERGTLPPPRRGVSLLDRIVLIVVGVVMLLEAAAIARLLQLRRRRRLRARRIAP